LNSLLLYGPAGSGKTAIAQVLCHALQAQGISVHALRHAEAVPSCAADRLVNCAPNHVYYVDSSDPTLIAKWLQQLQDRPAPRLLLVTRHCPAQLPATVAAVAVPVPTYEAFLGYAQYLGLPHHPVQIALMYRLWRGQFRGLQIIQTLPFRTGRAFRQQVLQVQRCLRG
jgi:hypothetical protein